MERGLPAPAKLLLSPKEAVAVWLMEFSCAAMTKSLKEAVAVWLVEFSYTAVTKSLKEAVADPTSTIATRYCM